MTILRLTNRSPTPFGGYLLALALICAAMPAQVVHVANQTDRAVVGWFQTNVDSLPPHASGSTPNANFVIGQRSGFDTHNIDVYTVVQPREHLTIDLAQSWFGGFQLPPPPTNNYLGGVPVKIAGVRMMQEAAEINGAGYDFRYMARVGPMLVVHLFLHWYPDQPWCRGEVVITASNPSVQDVVGFIPANFKLQVGDAVVSVPGLPPNPNLMAEGDWLADAQRRALPLTLTWPDRFGEHDAHTAQAWANLKIGIRGIAKLLPDGNPLLPPGFDAGRWTNETLPEVVARLHDWVNSPLDPAVDSGATGAQGSQAPGSAGPAMASPAAVPAFYLTALAASWPMFHLEQDGSTLNWKGHPLLHMNRGRVNRPIAADNLGKLNEPTSEQCHRHTGPEWEHWFHWNAIAGARLTGTPATQMFLEGHAVNFLHNFNVPWSPPSRGIGWYSLLAVELHRGLQNRELAEAVADKWRELWVRIIQPKFANGGFWSWSMDPRIGWTPGTPERGSTWQAAVGVFGVDVAAFQFGVPEAWNFAANAAVEIIDRAYFKQPTGWWQSWNIVLQDGSPPMTPAFPRPEQWQGFGEYFGLPMAVATVLRHNPGHWVAREIWAQLKKDSTTWQQASWLLPLPEAP